MKRKLLVLMSLLVVASLVLAACGTEVQQYPIDRTAREAFLVYTESPEIQGVYNPSWQASKTCSVSVGDHYTIDREVVVNVPYEHTITIWDQETYTWWTEYRTNTFYEVRSMSTGCSGYTELFGIR